MIRFATFVPSAFIALALVSGCASLRTAEQQEAVSPPNAAGKNLCLLESEDCPQRKMTITELIQGLRRELARGESVYTPAELRRLETRLREYEYMYDRLMFGNSD
ncbi:hypothetical protein EG829_14235 [bacterium]|nr:hypothetical protein [bacterium]